MINTLKGYALTAALSAVFVILLGFSVYTYYLRKENTSLTAQVDAKNTALGVLTAGAKDTDALVKSYGKTLQDLRDAETAREQKVADAQAQVDLLAKKNEEYAASLLAETPKSTDLCKAADALIDQYITDEGVAK